MNEQNTNDLVNAFPNLYSRMKCFECGDGWFELIRGLSIRLENLINDYKAEYPDDQIIPCASQVKEKYGTLRFYMSTETDDMSDAIDTYEHLSRFICEICGRMGRIYADGWVVCRCKECHERKFGEK